MNIQPGLTFRAIPKIGDDWCARDFFELAAPLMGPPAGSTANRLGLSLAGRYDSYNDVGSTFNPKVGVNWRPLALIKLRGNWGTSFHAPPFFWSNRDQVGDAGIEDVIDPRSPTGSTHALELFGPLPDLQPETSRAWTAGVDLTPPAIQNLSLSLTYFDIDYRGKIQHPGPDTAFFLTQEAATGRSGHTQSRRRRRSMPSARGHRSLAGIATNRSP